MHNSKIDTIVSELGFQLLTTNIAEFETSAKAYTGQIGAKDLPYLQTLLHNAPPEKAGTPDTGLGQWMAVCQYVIFEIIYLIPDEKTDFLKSIAFGVYDWTQANALETLCRMKIDGKLSDSIISEIDRNLGKMRYEAHLYFGRALLIRGKRDDRFLTLLNEFTDTGFQAAVRELQGGD